MGDTNNVLVIGNGFDIHHGMMTRYADLLRFYISVRDSSKQYTLSSDSLDSVTHWIENSFFDYFVSEYEDRKDIKSWIDLEHGIKQYAETLIDFFESENHQIISNVKSANVSYIKYYDHTEKVSLMLRNAHFLGRSDNNHIQISSKFVTFQGLYDIDAMITALANELHELESIVSFYLSNIEPYIREDSTKYHVYGQINDIDPSYIISFNYTNTINDLYNYNNSDISFIHGNLLSNNIVIGYEDSNHKTEDLVFKKYYRRIIKKADIINDHKLYYMNEYFQDTCPVFIFGHSLDLSDEDILRPLIETHTTTIFYLDDHDYAIKIRNLFLLLEKETILKNIKEEKLKFEKIVR